MPIGGGNIHTPTGRDRILNRRVGIAIGIAMMADMNAETAAAIRQPLKRMACNIRKSGKCRYRA